MSFLGALIYDKGMMALEEACLINWRTELLKNVKGAVLEIGAGTGASLDLYPHSPDLQLSLAEPDKNMRARLEGKIRSKGIGAITVLPCTSENILADNNSFDYVFSSLVCCSVNDLDASLKEIIRVLKPGGHFIFLEHVAAEHGSRRWKWQNRLNPLWRKMAGNCHLNRETESAIKNAGFTIHEVKRENMRKAMPLVRPTIRGIAKKN